MELTGRQLNLRTNFLGGTLLDTVIAAAADYYLRHEALEEDESLCVDIGSAFRTAVDEHVKDIENALILLDELAERVPEPGLIGSEDPHESWLNWLKSAFDCVSDGDPIAGLVIDELERRGIDHARHYANRQRIVHERA
jgi:hypothetical protein